jgi:hypothetical protein
LLSSSAHDRCDLRMWQIINKSRVIYTERNILCLENVMKTDLLNHIVLQSSVVLPKACEKYTVSLYPTFRLVSTDCILPVWRL